MYAIGEILLVVIGILLALQIDTWSNEQNLRQKELIYLREIRSNLEDDMAQVRYSIEFNQKKDSTISACLSTILKAESELKVMQVVSQSMPVLSEYRVFTQNRVAFDNMLSAENIDIISNDSLRTLISVYYSEENLLQGTQERVKDLTRIFVDNITPDLMNNEFINQFFGVENNFVSGEELEFNTNRVLFGDLFGMQRNIESHSLYLRGYQNIIMELMADLNRFLDSQQSSSS